MKPRVFIASSAEGLDVAKSLQINLEHKMEVTIWSQGVFDLSASPLESLLAALDDHNFGIFVFSADDRLTIRDQEKHSVRDNVLFELGLFVGRFGKHCNFIVKPRHVDLHISSDLYGITLADFDNKRSDGNIDAALGSVSTRIERQIFSLIEIEYPEAGHHGQNILSQKVTELKTQCSYSFKAKLKNNQSLIIKISSVNDNIWHYSVIQIGDWQVDTFDWEKREQYFHLKGSTESDLRITFQDGAEILIEYFENGDTNPSHSKTL